MWPFNRRSSIDGVVAITDTPLTEQHKLVRTLVERDRRRSARSRKGLLILSISLMGMTGGLTLALDSALPAIRMVPMVVQARPDGSTRVEPLMSLMSVEDAQDPVKRAELWQYVEWREGYSSDTAKFRYQFVTSLSSGSVGEAYAKWYNADNPDSPQVKYGKNHGVVTITLDSADFSSDPYIYVVNYWRDVHVPGQLPSKSHWTAYVHYRLVDQIPALDRTTINPVAVQVIEYAPPTETDAPGAKP